MNLPWFRLYAEFGTDPVIQSLSFEDQRHYVVLLCLKASGVLDRQGVSKSCRERIILRGLGVDAAKAQNVKKMLMRRRLLGDNWAITGWEKRQFPSDLSTERVRKYRKTHGTGNVSGTSEDRFGNGPDQDTEQNRSTNAELLKSNNSLLCAELSANGAETLAPNGSGLFLKTCKRGEEWEVPMAKISEWEDSYPDVDVKLTLLGIRQWLSDNPSKRKTSSGMVRFIGAWMMREQDKPDPSSYAKTKH